MAQPQHPQTTAASSHHNVVRRPAFLVQLLTCFIVSLALTNLWVGHLSSSSSGGGGDNQHGNNNGGNKLSHNDNHIRRTLIDSRVQSLLHEKRQALEKDLENRIEAKVKERLQQPGACKNAATDNTKSADGQRMGLSTISSIAQGMVATPRKEFLDVGVPHDTVPLDARDNVLVLYGRHELLPDSVLDKNERQFNKNIPYVYHHQTKIPLLPQNEALERCNKVIVLPKQEQSSCIALVPHHGEGHHVQHWARVSETMERPDKHEIFGKNQPLKLVSRVILTNGIDEFQAPKPKLQREALDMFQGYFAAYTSVKQDMQALLQPPDAAEKNGGIPHLKPYQNQTVIVMVANYGQAEILANFVCAARARKLDTSSVLVFATDTQARDWAQSLGLAAIYNEELFKMIPQQEARLYGDSTFKFMMTVKVISVQLTLHLGFDVLFQDADIIWHKHPLQDYFWDTKRWKDDASNGGNSEGDALLDRYDVIGQEDGSRSLRYSPYYMNSGFYYVRHNDRSVAFLDSLLLQLPLMLTNKSHQQAMIEVMSQHVSLYGLRVKVISRESPDLPCGFHFHHITQRNYMKQVTQGKLTPIIFHMSWTLNKDNKIHYLEQMDEWRVQPQCVGTKALDVAANVSAAGSNPKPRIVDLVPTCCAAKPLFQCHYRDKPSTRPCRDSPPLDKGAASFW